MRHLGLYCSTGKDVTVPSVMQFAGTLLKKANDLKTKKPGFLRGCAVGKVRRSHGHKHKPPITSVRSRVHDNLMSRASALRPYRSFQFPVIHPESSRSLQLERMTAKGGKRTVGFLVRSTQSLTLDPAGCFSSYRRNWVAETATEILRNWTPFVRNA